MTLTEFLTARLDADEAAAKAATAGPWASAGPHDWIVEQAGPVPAGDLHMVAEMYVCHDHDDLRRQDAEHIARHDPARVLREVEAKRKILDDPYEYGGEPVLHVIAAVYSDHPDYQPGWA